MLKTLSYSLKEVIKLFCQNRTLELRGLSNRLIREATIEDNFSKAELGVIAYYLHKMETKTHFSSNKNWPRLKKSVVKNLENALFYVQKNDDKNFIFSLKKVIKNIEDIDSKLGHYAQNIYEKAKVKQASLAYSYGLSIAQSAELTGADKKDVQSYVGFTTMHDEEPEKKTLITRVSTLKKLLRDKKDG